MSGQKPGAKQMRDSRVTVPTFILGTIFTVASILAATPADASPHHHHARTQIVAHHAQHAAPHHVVHAASHSRHHVAHWRVTHTAGISCVPFARKDSGIEVSGNAWQWWDNAAGVYARGHVPQPGSVLTFRSNPHMRLGHVAVVTKVINRREIEIDHANWSHGAVSRGITVVDVSEANDWTAVRVALDDGDRFGSVYPTYGFIYDRPDTGMMVAAAHAPSPQPALNPAPTDLRPAAERPWQVYEEVAEAPDGPRHHVEVAVNGRVGSIDRK
jgi:surface antigen